MQDRHLSCPLRKKRFRVKVKVSQRWARNSNHDAYSPQKPPLFQEQTREREPISKYTNVPNIIHESTERIVAYHITYRQDNYAHFLSEKCEHANVIIKLLIATERLDLQDFRESRPKKGQILVTPHGQHKTYLIVVKRRRFDEVGWKDVTQ